MAEHRVRKNNIIYVIPTDALFEKWKRNEAFIDDYGRLMNRKPNRVLKELKHYVDNPLAVQRNATNPPAAPVKKQSAMIDYLKDTVRDRVLEASEDFIDRAVDTFFYEVLPGVWYEHIVPLYHEVKEALTTKEIKATTVLSEAKVSSAVKKKSAIQMSREESDAEKRKALYHWLELLNSLTKLQNAGELDLTATLEQLTNPAALKQVNGFLEENPNLLETDKYIFLNRLLGRNLYTGGQLVPIEAIEIIKIVAHSGVDIEPKKTEE